jgi:hypothetical protein
VRNRLTPTLISLIAVLVLTLGLVAPAFAAGDKDQRVGRAFAVYHGPVVMALSDADSDGHQLGDLRVTSVPTTDADGGSLGRLEATLTTTSIDTPSVGDEARSGTLIFTFGEQGQSQIVVHGSAHYPGEAPTIATGDVTTRPIVGGSGRFAGASGDAVTTHLEDDTWSHRFELDQSRADKVVERTARQRLRGGIREWRDDHKDAREERKEARDEAKAARKGDKGSDAIDELYTEAAADQTGVVRADLGIAEPGSAPGQELGLWHYTIHVGSELPPHTHPGWQLARITAGELEYSVESGEGILLRADGSSEPMGPGTYILAPGDGVIENPELVHFGANRTDEIVTLISATLFTAGDPIASLIEEPADAVVPEASPSDG